MHCVKSCSSQHFLDVLDGLANPSLLHAGDATECEEDQGADNEAHDDDDESPPATCMEFCVQCVEPDGSAGKCLLELDFVSYYLCAALRSSCLDSRTGAASRKRTTSESS